MINLLKEKDIENGLTFDQYIDWCKLYNDLDLYRIPSTYRDGEITKKELMDYYDREKKINRKSENNKKIFGKLILCLSCNNSIKITKSRSILYGCDSYIITCKKQKCTFEVNWDDYYGVACKNG